MYLQLIKTNSKEYINFPCEIGTVYFCTDNNKVFIDRSDRYRQEITLSSEVCETLHEFEHLGGYREEILYIISNENFFYIYIEGKVKRVLLYQELVNIIIQDPSKMNPKVLRQNGNAIAPRTTSNAIYDRNGNNMAETIEGWRNDVRNLNKTYDKTVICYEEGQTIFTIPYPTYHYEVTTDNLFISINNVMITPDQYVINKTKITFNEPLHYNDRINFVFHYHVVQNLNDVPPDSVGLVSLKEEVRSLISDISDIDDIVFPDGSSLNKKIDEIISQLKGSSGEPGIKDSILNLYADLIDFKNNELNHNNIINQKFEEYDNIISEMNNKMDIIINNTTAEQTSMSAVKRVQRGVATMEVNNETVEIMLEHEINPEKVSITLHGDSYYNETPYIYEVLPDRFIVRQKSPNVTPIYVSYFSWELIEFI